MVISLPGISAVGLQGSLRRRNVSEAYTTISKVYASPLDLVCFNVGILLILESVGLRLNSASAT